MMAQAGMDGKPCAFIDADGNLDPVFCLHYGINQDNFYLCRITETRQILEISTILCRSALFSIVVVDSLETILEEDKTGKLLHERLITTALPSLVQAARNHGTILIFTQHDHPWIARTYHHLKIQIPKLSFALHADVHLEVKPEPDRNEWMHTSTMHVPRKVNISILKGKKSRAQTPIQMILLYNHWIERCDEILELGVQAGLIQNQDSTFTFRNQRLGCDRTECRDFLSQHKKLAEIIEQDIRKWFVARTGLV